MRPLRMVGVLRRNMENKELLYFTADWCMPCKAYAPRLSKEAERLGLTLVRIDADEHPDMIEEFGVMSLPTVIIMTNGLPGERLIGAKSDAELHKALKA